MIDTTGAAEVAVFAGNVSPTVFEAVLEFTEGVTFESVARTEHPPWCCLWLIVKRPPRGCHGLVGRF